MAMTLAQIRSLVLGYLNELRGTDNALFPNADIDAEVNAALSEIVCAVNMDFYKSFSNVNMTATAITLPTDFLGQADCFLITDSASASGRRPLRFTTRQVMDENNTNWRGQTAQYPTTMVIEWDSGTPKLQPYPAPTSTITLGSYTTYVKKPTALSAASDSSDVFTYLPDFERKLIPWVVVKNILQFEAGEMDDRVQRLEGMCQNAYDRMRARLNQMFNTTNTYGSYGSSSG